MKYSVLLVLAICCSFAFSLPPRQDKQEQHDEQGQELEKQEQEQNEKEENAEANEGDLRQDQPKEPQPPISGNLADPVSASKRAARAPNSYQGNDGFPSSGMNQGSADAYGNARSPNYYQGNSGFSGRGFPGSGFPRSGFPGMGLVHGSLDAFGNVINGFLGTAYSAIRSFRGY